MGTSRNSAFCESKMLLSSADVLAHFDPTRRSSWHVCDALLYSIGAILSHKMPDGTDHPVGELYPVPKKTTCSWRKRDLLALLVFYT